MRLKRISEQEIMNHNRGCPLPPHLAAVRERPAQAGRAVGRGSPAGLAGVPAAVRTSQGQCRADPRVTAARPATGCLVQAPSRGWEWALPPTGPKGAAAGGPTV